MTTKREQVYDKEIVLKPTVIVESDLWNWLRRLVTRRKKQSKKGYPRTYLMPVYLEHPEVPGFIFCQQICIAANSRAHARMRLRNELVIRIGTPRHHEIH